MPSLKTYWAATRPFAFTASVIPSVMGAIIALAMYSNNPAFHFNWIAFILTIFGCVSVQASCNLINDYFDFKSGLDTTDNFGVRNVLVRNAMTLGQMRMEIMFTMVFALAIGAYLIVVAGTAVLWFVVFGFLSAIFYTAPPVSLKYRGLGDIQVVMSFGVIMTLGAFYIQANYLVEHTWTAPELWKVIVYSLPSGLLIDAILHANNHRDLYGDKSHGIKTLATILGDKPSLAALYIIVVSAYVLIVGMVVAGYLTPFALITLLTIPKALIVLRKAGGRTTLDPMVFNMIEPEAAQLHTIFGVAMIVAFLASYFTKI